MSTGGDTLEHAGRTYKKVASSKSTPSEDRDPQMVSVQEGLTIFLGGAGMAGTYIEDMISALIESGIQNPVSGSYAAYSSGPSRYMPDLVRMLGDAAAVVLYNQDEFDPVVFQYGEPAACEYGDEYVEKKYLFGKITVRRYNEVRCEPPSSIFLARISREISEVKQRDFSLSMIGINKTLPQIGQLNLIGYSWGSIIAARTALFHARNGTTINNLVLIGAPINKSLLEAAKLNDHILNVHVLDLTAQGDPIYAGMTDKEIVDSAAVLGQPMLDGSGHFYYSADNNEGRKRRRELATELYSMGLR